ncbi:MAG: protein-ADP-ribose hydrolase [Clostridia bacterium]|nr:protein-ADP-ribose hydrolase [Clostridia bacterium]
MTQGENRKYLIEYLLNERGEDSAMPQSETQQKMLLRSLMNVRPPRKAESAFLRVQDEYLRAETEQKGITDASSLKEIAPNICLWQGDITTLKCDGIVNAANSQMLGCFCPCHGCIDNAIHTFAGVQLRQECAKIMQAQGHSEPVGIAKITGAYNLPCKYVLHTVGPVVYGKVTQKNKRDLANCYLSCLELAIESGLESLAFCCISTGEFHFPPDMAAGIAVQTVKDFLSRTGSKLKVIFNVFKDSDYEIYSGLLGASR